MTDVLEPLLKETEEVEDEWEFPWSPVRMAPASREALETIDMHGQKRQSALQVGREETARVAELFRAEIPTEQTLSHRLDATQIRQKAAWSISDRMARLRQAAQWRGRGTAPSGSMDGPVFGQDNLLVRGAVEEKRHTADYAARVDAVFARDARRYDGPLRLL